VGPRLGDIRAWTGGLAGGCKVWHGAGRGDLARVAGWGGAPWVPPGWGGGGGLGPGAGGGGYGLSVGGGGGGPLRTGWGGPKQKTKPKKKTKTQKKTTPTKTKKKKTKKNHPQQTKVNLASSRRATQPDVLHSAEGFWMRANQHQVTAATLFPTPQEPLVFQRCPI